MIGSILVVCARNICRSPVGERLLVSALASGSFSVSSAGLSVLVGQGADERTADVASRHGLSLDGHVARHFTPELGRAHDLILVMEAAHRSTITRHAPDLSGRCLLFDQWTGTRGIANPHRRPDGFHETVFTSLKTASEAWSVGLLACTSYAEKEINSPTLRGLRPADSNFMNQSKGGPPSRFTSITLRTPPSTVSAAPPPIMPVQI